MKKKTYQYYKFCGNKPREKVYRWDGKTMEVYCTRNGSHITWHKSHLFKIPKIMLTVYKTEFKLVPITKEELFLLML